MRAPDQVEGRHLPGTVLYPADVGICRSRVSQRAGYALKKALTGSGFWHLVQGKTNDNGLIWVPGASNPDLLQT